MLTTSPSDQVENETRGQWYARQMAGSANLSGSRLLHLMSGNLSHQIEHHAFPDMPSNRYIEIAPRVRALCKTPRRAVRRRGRCPGSSVR